MITYGNLAISLRDEKLNFSCLIIVLFLDRTNDETSAAARTYAAISKIILYVASKFSRRIEPKSGPIMNPVVKKPVKVAIFLTRGLPLLTFEMIASQGGQKNACATPVITLKLIISGTLCAIESRYTDAELITTPMDSRCPLLNLFKKIPTNNGKNMYGIKFANPMIPNSAYDAPITFFAKSGNRGPCNPYEIPISNPVM